MSRPRTLHPWAWFLFATLVFTLPAKAAAPRKVALLIGNQGYPAIEKGVNKFGPLLNPANDVADMKQLLTDYAFEVRPLVLDADKATIEARIRTFIDGLPKDSLALIYYSGHGTEDQRINYLLPIRPEGFRSGAEVKRFAIEANWIMEELGRSRAAASILILDACRDHIPLDPAKGSRDEGFVPMRMNGVLVAYATSTGKTAWGSKGRNSLYTQNLIAAWRARGREPVELIFKEAATRVRDFTQALVTRGELEEPQVPWFDPGLLGDNFCPDPAGCVPSFRPPELSRTGSLRVLTRPHGAILVINGTDAGPVSASGLSWAELTPGTYRLQARLSGYQELVQSVEVRAGAEKEVVLALSSAAEAPILPEPVAPRMSDPSMSATSRRESPQQAAARLPYDSENGRGDQSRPKENDHYVDNHDGTVTDKSTGLRWMRCTLGQTWDGSNCLGAAESYTWREAIAIQNFDFAGYSDWRVPSFAELVSLVNCSVDSLDTSLYYGMAGVSCGWNVNYSIDIKWFPNCPEGAFWSTNVQPGNDNSGQIFGFARNWSWKDKNSSTNYAHVRLVRTQRI